MADPGPSSTGELPGISIESLEAAILTLPGVEPIEAIEARIGQLHVRMAELQAQRKAAEAQLDKARTVVDKHQKAQQGITDLRAFYEALKQLLERFNTCGKDLCKHLSTGFFFIFIVVPTYRSQWSHVC